MCDDNRFFDIYAQTDSHEVRNILTHINKHTKRVQILAMSYFKYVCTLKCTQSCT